MLRENRDGKLVTDKNTGGFRHLRVKHNIFLDHKLGEYLVEEAEDSVSKSMKSKKRYGVSGADSDEAPTSGGKRSKAMPSSQKTGKERKRGYNKRGKKKKGKQPDKKSEFWDSCIILIFNLAPLTSPLCTLQLPQQVHVVKDRVIIILVRSRWDQGGAKVAQVATINMARCLTQKRPFWKMVGYAVLLTRYQSMISPVMCVWANTCVTIVNTI